MFRRNESFKEFIYAYPIVTGLVAINLVIWLITGLFNSQSGNLLYQLGAGVNLLITNGEYWRLVTPIFLHAPNDITHVLFNCFSLVIFGPALEQMLGKAKFIIAYLGAGILGNVGTYLLAPNEFSIHIGASGAIYGLLGIYIFMKFFRKHLIDPGNAQIVVVILVIGLIMSLFNIRINLAGHFFGFVGGFLLAPLVLVGAKPFSLFRNRRPRSKFNEEDVQFDPDRWKKRPYGRRNNQRVIWIIIITLVIIGFFDYFN